MSNLSLREIAQSQLDSTPVIDGQLIVCLDTGNAYRDTATAHVKIGSDLEVVSDLPLAPLAEKIYYLKPDKLYVFLGGNWTLLNDKTIDLDEAIAKLPAESSTTLNDDVEIITQDTDITQPHYYRRKLVVLWKYIKTKAQDFFAAKNHQHGKADITDFPTSMPASDVYPWAKAATKPSYTKAEVGLGKVDNTADADKTVKRATTSGTADSANSVAWKNVRDKPTTFPVEAHNHDDRYYTEAEIDGKLEKKSSTDHTHDLSELISALSIDSSTTLNDSVQIITQDTDTANQKYYRRPLTVLWNYIKSKADSVYSAIGHNHKIQNLEDYTTRVYDATIVRPADTVLASPQDKDGIATFRKLDKNDVGLENVDNTADKNKNVATAGIATTGVRDYNNANNIIKIGWSGTELDADSLTYVSGYTSDKKIHPASKDGVRSWLGLGDSAYKNTKSRSSKGSTDWTNNATDDAIVPTMSFMAYWDGAYNSNGASNLSYCDRGRFGTIVTKNTGDYAVAGHTHLNGTKSGAVDWNTFITYGVYKIQNCTMDDARHAPPDEYAFGILQVLDSENNGGEKRIIQIYWPHSTAKGNHLWYRMHNSSDINAGWSGWTPIKNKPDTSGVSDITNALSGFTPRSGQNWGVQTGTFVHGEGDSTGGDFAFRKDCPNAGQVSMVLDGRFYQNEGQYRVLDESDISGIRTRSDIDLGVPLAKASDTNTAPWAGTADNPTFEQCRSMIGTEIDGSGTWWTVLSIRHRNGAGDGPSYGLLLFSQLTNTGDTLWYRKQSGNWTENRNILDSTNYGSYALPLTGGTISGAVTANTYYAPNWFRATGDSGFYFENHGGGWYMIDDTWIRAYNNKNIYTPGVIQCDSGFNGNLNGNVNGTINGIQVKSGYNVSTNFPNQVCTELGVDSGNHNFLATLRCSQGNNSGMPQHGSGAVWGCGDTQGYIYTSYYGPEVWIGGGNANKFVWQKQLAFLDSKVSSSGYADSAGSATALNMNSAGNGNSIYGSGNDAVNGPGGGLNNVVISSWYGVSFTSPCGVGYGGKNQTAVGIDCREGIVKAARFDGYLNGTATNAEYLGNDAAYMRMHWNGQGGQPTWLWGGNDASNMYVWNPSNFSVNYANSAGNGVVASGSNYVRFGDGTQICWGQQGIANAGTTITFAVAFSSIPAVVNSGTEDIDDVFFVRNITTTNFVADKIGWFSGNNTWIAIGRWK